MCITCVFRMRLIKPTVKCCRGTADKLGNIVVDAQYEPYICSTFRLCIAYPYVTLNALQSKTWCQARSLAPWTLLHCVWLSEVRRTNDVQTSWPHDSSDGPISIRAIKRYCMWRRKWKLSNCDSQRKCEVVASPRFMALAAAPKHLAERQQDRSPCMPWTRSRYQTDMPSSFFVKWARWSS